MISIEERFWSKVEFTDTCWLWTGAKFQPKGYGMFGVRGKLLGAHRVAWMLVHGCIPAGQFVCHHCDNPPCVRLDHLWLGTNAENIADAKRKGRLASGDRASMRVHPESRLRGERHPNAVLTEQLVLEMRRRAALGESGRAIARALGVNPYAVYDVLTGRCWRHAVHS